MDVLTAVVATAALLLGGTAAGVFFTYSNSVLPALDAIRPDQAISAMTSMNRKIMNPRFLVTLVGTLVLPPVAGVLLLVVDETGPALLYFGATAAFVLGVMAPTNAVNVPLNEALNAGPVPDDEAEAARVWSDFSGRWHRWNNLRTVSCLVTLLLMGIGLLTWSYTG